MKKYVSNKLLILIFGTSLMVGACSKEDEGEVKPEGTDLEEVSLSLAEESVNNAIEVPQGMSSSDNEYAQMAVGYVNMVNTVGSYFTYFKPPAGAEQSNQPISPSNARMGAANKEYLVYKWTHQDITVAYQLSDEGDKYVWEIFWKQGDEGFKKYVYAEENKTAKQGMMKVYNIFEGKNEELYIFSWDKKENGALVMTGSFPAGGFSYTVSVNPDASGDVVYYESDKKLYAMTWTSKGDGTWTAYEDGKKSFEGTWQAAS